MIARIFAADPGLSGALAILAGAELDVLDAPVAGGELDVDEIARFVCDARPDFAVIERVNAMPKQGVSSTFKFGMSYGALRAVVAVCGIPQHLVTPALWKKHFRLNSDKEQSRALAIRLWPGNRVLQPQKGPWPRRGGVARTLRRRSYREAVAMTLPGDIAYETQCKILDILKIKEVTEAQRRAIDDTLLDLIDAAARGAEDDEEAA